jgi:hypothetical protein
MPVEIGVLTCCHFVFAGNLASSLNCCPFQGMFWVSEPCSKAPFPLGRCEESQPHRRLGESQPHPYTSAGERTLHDAVLIKALFRLSSHILWVKLDMHHSFVRAVSVCQ